MAKPAQLARTVRPPQHERVRSRPGAPDRASRSLSLHVVILALIRAARSRQRAWFISFLSLLPVGYYGWIGLLEGLVGLAAVDLVPALVTTAYFVWTPNPDRSPLTSS